MQNDDYYGAPTNSGVKMIRERLRDKYEAGDFVTVINADTTPLTYQFANPADTETFSDYPGHKNTVQKRPPQRITLQPGDTKLVPAYEADQMIEAGIKQVAMRRLNDKVESGELDRQRATTDWTAPDFQIHWIDQFLVGKKDILGEYNQPKVSAEKDLELDEKRPIGRPKLA